MLFSPKLNWLILGMAESPDMTEVRAIVCQSDNQGA